MSAIRMEEDHSITVLIDPQNENGETVRGVYLTRDYINPTGILPQENLFISKDEKWFYWLGYNKMNKVTEEVPETDINNSILDRIYSYLEEYSSENQCRLFIESQCSQCGKQDTLWCIMQCPYSN